MFLAVLQILYIQGTLLQPAHLSILLLCSWLYSKYCTFKVLYSNLPTCPFFCCVPGCTQGTVLSRYCTPTCPLVHSFAVFLAVPQVLYFQGTLLQPAHSSILLLCSWLYSRCYTFKVLYSNLPVRPSFCCVLGCTPGNVISRYCTPTCPLIHSFAVFLAVLHPTAAPTDLQVGGVRGVEPGTTSLKCVFQVFLGAFSILFPGKLSSVFKKNILTFIFKYSQVYFQIF